MIYLLLLFAFADIPTQNLYIPKEYNTHWEIENPPELAAILSQKLTYLGEGAQCIAYETQNHQYVIKFFKATHTRPREWFKCWFDSKEKTKRRREKWDQKFAATCERYVMAYHNLREETGLLYLHFNPDPEHLTAFIVQRKAELIPSRLKRLIAKKDYIGIAQTLTSLETLFEKRARKGFTDERQSFSINFGFIENRAIQIDVGKIVQNDELKAAPEKERMRIKEHLYAWLKKHPSR